MHSGKLEACEINNKSPKFERAGAVSPPAGDFMRSRLQCPSISSARVKLDAGSVFEIASFWSRKQRGNNDDRKGGYLSAGLPMVL